MMTSIKTYIHKPVTVLLLLVSVWIPSVGKSCGLDCLWGQQQQYNTAQVAGSSGIDVLHKDAHITYLRAIDMLTARLESLSGTTELESWLNLLASHHDEQIARMSAWELLSVLEQTRVEFRSAVELKGRFAAYASKGHLGVPQIYINADWLNSGVPASWVEQIILEELGHAAYDRLVSSKVAGDYGAMFAAMVLNWDLSADQVDRMRLEQDVHTITIDGRGVQVHFASFQFANVYAVYTGQVGSNSFVADKESNRHHIAYVPLGAGYLDDERIDQLFSGNDVVSRLDVAGNSYFGWVSRPIKSGGVTRGFYMWTDPDFTSMALAVADGNRDSDSDAFDNYAFVLVVDQAYFDNLEVAGVIDNVEYKFVGSSSDPVANALNALIPPNRAPNAVNDASDLTIQPGMPGGPAREAGGLNNGTAGANAIGNVLENDSDPDNNPIRVSGIGKSTITNDVQAGTTSANGSAVVGRYGTITIGADGSYRYIVDDTNAEVQRLRQTTDTLSEDFIYRISDTAGLSSTATLTLVIVGANDNPVAANDYNSAKESLLPGSDANQYTANDTKGILAQGNVLYNDTDVDGFEENLTVDVLTGQFTVQSVTPQGASTTLRFLGDSGFASVSAGRTLYYNDNGVFRAIRTASGSLITIQSKIDLGNNNYDIVLSDNPSNYRTTASDPATAVAITDYTGLPVGFASSTNDPGPSGGSMKTATVASANQSGSSLVTLVPNSELGVVGVGMSVTGNGVPLDSKISEVEYDVNGIVRVVVNKTLTSASEDVLTTSATQGTSVLVRHGSIVLEQNGEYTYKPRANNPELSEGQSALEVFPYVINDDLGAESTATLYITVWGSGQNDPTAEEDAVTAIEAGGSFNATAGVNPTGNVLDNDSTPSGTNTVVGVRTTSSSDVTPVTGAGTSIEGQYGTLTIGSDGTFTYVVNNTDETVQALRDDTQTLTEVFLYTIENGNLAGPNRLSATTTLTITIRGRNDAPIAVNDVADAVQAGNITTGISPTGNVIANDNDVDGLISELRITSFRTGNTEGFGTAGTLGSLLAGSFGSLRMNEDGTWNYTVDPNNLTVKSLSENETLVDHFNYTVTDRNGEGLSDLALLSITILGYDDELRINNVFVNEASPFAVFTIEGLAGSEVSLQIGSDISENDVAATSGLDYQNTLEFFNGTSWELYNPNNPPQIPSGNVLLVRIPILQDDVHEGLESFTLTASAAGYTTASGAGVINDEGEGDVYLASNTTGTPNTDTDPGYPVLDDDRPIVSVTDISVTEGDVAQIVVSIDKISTQPIRFTPALVSGTADVGVDTADESTLEYSSDGGLSWSVVNGQVTIEAGTSSLMFRISTIDDVDVEDDETFTFETGVILGSVKNSDGASGEITILNNDSAELTVSNTTVNEGSDWAVFEVGGQAGQPLSLNLNQGNGDGFADLGNARIEYWDGENWIEYVSGTVTIPASGPLYVRVNIEAEQDEDYEGPETFKLVAVNASGDEFSGTGTIVDDGTGVIFTSGDPADADSVLTSGLDDDRALQVNNVTVNEGSDWAVFQVSGAAGQLLTLSVDQGSGAGFATLGDAPAIQIWNGTAWVAYTGTASLPASGPLYVRVDIRAEQDDVYEGSESFRLVATNTGGTPSAADQGTGTIVDDGTGVIFTSGDPADADSVLTSGLDDDRALQVNNVTVNEGSDWAVFQVSGAAGQLLTLSVDQGSGAGFATLGDAPAIQIWNGTAWVAYTGTASLPASGPLYVRVDIRAEQDDVYEGSESFRLVATNTGGTPSAADQGTGTIVDDGTGVIFTSGDPADADSVLTSGLDDDRALQVNNVTVNEGSDWAVFQVSGAAGQLLTLSVDQGSGAGFATLGDAPAIQIWNGTAWVAYTGTASLPASGPLYVRVDIRAEQDDVYEGSESFRLVATNTGGTPSAADQGTGTIVDDGTGVIFTSGDPADADSVLTSGLDDDRALQVNNVTVNEGSDWAVFQVSGAAGQLLTLSVDQGSGAGFATLGDAPAIQIWNGTAWVAYTGTASLPASGPLYVRVDIRAEQDDVYEGSESFRLVATNTGGTPSAADQGTGTIVDDGTGVIFTSGDPADADSVLTSGLDDDRALQVNNVTVNEGSDWAVFQVSGAAGQLLTLSVDQGSGAGFATLGDAPAIQIWNGTAWVAYTGTASLPASGPLYVRVDIRAEQDDVYEGSESFRLVATNTGGTPSAADQGTGTIVDDGTGVIFTSGDPADADSVLTSGLDDDRALQVNNVTVNEGSDWAVFQVSGAAGQLLTLSVDQGSGAGFATLGDAPAIQIWNGTAWVAYTGTASLPASGPLYVRVDIRAEQDDVYEGSESFRLVATNTGGTPSAADQGTGTIVDDGTGVIFTSGDPADADSVLTSGLDDDRALQVNNVTVNEGSDWAVFQVSGAAGQLLTLSVDQGSGAGFATLGDAPAIQIWNGTAWVAYTGTASLPASGPLYVRVDIRAEQDDVYEGSESFRLVATNTGGTPSAADQGTGTIVDDGTGEYWIGDALLPATPDELDITGIILDDDRRVFLPAKPDVNTSFINEVINGNINTNDAMVAPFYTFKSASPDNKPNATISINPDGSYVFNAEFPGVYIYFITVTGVPLRDKRLHSETELFNDAISVESRLTITVLDPNGLDNPPVVNTDIATIRSGNSVTIRSLSNDRPGSIGRALVPGSVIITEQPVQGTVLVDPLTGDINYQSVAGFVGEVIYTYEVCDDNTPAQCASGIQLVTVISRSAPNTTLAADDFAYTYSSKSVTGNVLINDTDPEGHNQAITPIAISSVEGSLEIQADGSFNFISNPGFSGQYEVTYEVCDDGPTPACANGTLYLLVNRQMANPDINATFTGYTVNGSVATNDQTVPGSFYGAVQPSATNPAVAEISLASNGTYTFRATVPGIYTYTVPVCTNQDGLFCLTETLTIYVTDPELPNTRPIVQTDVAHTILDRPVTLLSLANDSPGRPGLQLVANTVRVVQAPVNGTATVDPQNGNILYAPNANFAGTDVLIYEVCDNNTPAGCSRAEQRITVTALSSRNITFAADDYVRVVNGATVTGNLLLNDNDPEGHVQQVIPATVQGASGTFSVNQNGIFTFVPTPGFAGSASFVYTVCDSGVPVACSSATVYIQVHPEILRSLIKVSGDQQIAKVNETLPQELVVEVRNQFGDIIPGAQVTFEVVSVPDRTQTLSITDLASGSSGSGVNATVTVITNNAGIARVTMQLPDRPGIVDIEVTSTGLNTVMFTVEALPDRFDVEQNWPNPFRDRTTIPVILPEPANTSIHIYDIEGKLVEVLLSDQSLTAGLHNVVWNASRYASGVYIYRVIARGQSGKLYTKTLRLTVIN
jgi:VCBS repeat-containing protein